MSTDDRPEDTPGPYGRLARWSARHRVAVLLAVIALAVVAGFFGLPPKVDNNVLSMMPPDDPVIQATQALNDEGGVDFLLLGYSDPAAEGRSERLDAFVDEVAQAFRELDDVEFVLHELDPDLAFRIGLLQIDSSDVRELTSRLRGAVALGPAMNPVIAQRVLDLQPVTDRMAKAREASLFGEGGKVARLVVRPITSSQDRAFALKFYDEMQAVLAAHPPEPAGLELTYVGGSYRHVPEDIRTLSRDLGWTSGVATVLVLLLVTLAFRDLRATVIVFIPIIFANVLTLGLVGIWIGHLNSFTAAAVPVLVGLGIDFGIHLFGRYRELRAGGLAQEDALAAAWDRTGPPSVTAGLTSAAGFLALTAASFRGFSQFGVVLAFGLLACLGMMLVLLPPLITWLDPKPGRALPGVAVESKPSTSTYRLAPVGLMVAVLLTGVVGAIRLPHLSFDFDISSMRAGDSYQDLTEQERELAHASYSPVALSFDTQERVVRAAAHIDKRIADGDLPLAAGTVSVDDVLPADMRARLDDLRALATVVRSPNMRYLHASPARPMVEALMPLREMDLRPLTEADLPPGLLGLMGGGGTQPRLLVLPNGNMWDMRNALALTRELQRLEPDAAVAGPVSIQGLLFSYVMVDVPLVGGLALLLVGLLAAIDLKKPVMILGALGTLLAGLTWAGVMLQAAGVQLSVVNIVGVPILLGIGVDVVIHLLHRLEEEGPGGVRRAWRTTGVAALVSTLTTVASFGALMMGSSRGVQSLGLLVVVGLSTITLVGALLLPLAWAAGWRVTGRAPGEQDRD